MHILSNFHLTAIFVLFGFIIARDISNNLPPPTQRIRFPPSSTSCPIGFSWVQASQRSYSSPSMTPLPELIQQRHFLRS